jgi:hypothetical protein
MSRINLPPGVYTGGIPAGYVLGITGEGNYIEPPAGPRTLGDLLPAGPSNQPQAAAQSAVGPALAWVAGKLKSAAPVVVGIALALAAVSAVLRAVPHTPARPDWMPAEEIGRPAEPAASEWRPLPYAPGWEGYGRDVDGKFMIETWRRAEAAAQAEAQPAPVVPVQYATQPAYYATGPQPVYLYRGSACRVVNGRYTCN